MAYNGDAPRNIKRERSDSEGMMRNHRGGGGGAGEFYGDEPVRKRKNPYGSGEDNKSFRSSSDHERPNHVLLFTILNPVYPITTEVIHTICSPSGQVQRIVIFKKNGVQAMVEFGNVDEAKRAKDALQGADIYSGCCTLKIDYAKPTKLNVYKNDSESWDYTSPPMGKSESSGRSQPLLAAPRYGAGPQPYGESRGGGGGGGGGSRGSAPYNQGGGGGGGGGNLGDRFDDSYQNGPGHMSGGGGGGGGGGGFGGGDPYGERYPPSMERYGSGRDSMYANQRGPGGPGGPGNNTSMGAGLMAPSSAPQHSAVLMAYNLPMTKINCDKLFNLLCLYGNVSKVKFLKTKEGCAMVMMGDALAVERTITNLNGTPLKDGGKLELGYSKQAFLADVPNPYQLPDNTPSFKDFSGSKNNRFMNPAMASKNRIQTPSKILHFFNTPPNATEDQFYEVFEECGVSRPKSIKIFQGKSERSSAGLLEFEDVKDAVDALMNCNHHPIDNPGGKFPYNMKLCFSSARSMREPRDRDGRDGKDDD